MVRCTQGACNTELAAPIKQEQVLYTKETFYSSFEPDQADTPRFELTETEKFVLSLCLSLIRRERNHILTNHLDASEIHQHFINPHLTRDFDHFVDQAYEVYQYLNSDCDLQLLVKGANKLDHGAASDLSPICNELLANGAATNGDCEPDSADTYDLLKDYLIISPTAYNISMTSLNNINNDKSSPVTRDLHLNGEAMRKKSLASKYGVSQRSWDQFLNDREV